MKQFFKYLLLSLILTFSTLQSCDAQLLGDTRIKKSTGVYLFDTYSNGVAGYSLRKLKNDAVYGIVVRRSSDDAETDVELYDSGSIDLLSIVSAGGTLGDWVGVNSAFISRWYDQTGNGNTLSGGLTSAQPRLINSGILDTKGSLSAMLFDGVNDTFTDLAGGGFSELDDGNDFTCFGVASNNTSNDLGGIIITDITNRFQLAKDNRTQKRCAFVVASGTDAFSDLNAQDSSTNQKVLSVIVDGTAKDIESWSDGDSSVLSGAWSGVYTNSGFAVGGGASGSFLTGYIQEVLVFSGKHASRSEIHSDINNYYSIY